MIELITELIDGSRYELDISEDSPIALTKTFAELLDIEKRKGSFSRSFVLPSTPRNDYFFGQFGDPSSVGTVWSPAETPNCWLLENSNIILEGTLKLEEVRSDNEEYSISISGVIFLIKTLLGDSLISDLDMSSWTFTPSQIVTTWGRTIFGGDMVFPIHDFGFGYGLYKKSTTANVLKDISTTGTPITLNECIPAFRLNELIRMIFSAQGLALTGTWFSESEVEEIYVQANNPLSSFVSLIGMFSATHTSGSVTLDTTVRKLKYICSPVHADFDNTNFQYVAPAAGTYYFDFNFTPTPGTPSTQTCYYGWYVNNVLSGSNINFTWNAGVTVTGKALTLAAGDTVDIRVAATSGYTATGSVGFSASYKFSLTSVTVTGTSVDPSEYWTNIKQIDFLKGVLQIFNLIIWQDEQKRINIDTWDQYMATYGSKKDWSDKVDIRNSPRVRPVNSELRNPVNLELTHANNVLNTEYRDIAGRAYGSYREDTRLPFTKEAMKPFALFSPGPVQEIISSVASAAYADLLVAKMYESEDNIEYKAPGLQLFYYNGTKAAGKTYYTQDASGGATTARTTFPYFSNFRLYSASSWNVLATTLDLNFTYWSPPSPAIVSAPSEQGLYNRYFRNMLQDRYAEGIKIVEFEAILDPIDIAEFDFADTVIITLNGTPVGLRILEIRDYSPNVKKATKIKAMITFIK